MKKYKNNIISAILSVILVIFIWHKFLISGNSIILVLIFMSGYYFINRAINNTCKRECIVATIIAVVFRHN